MKPRVAGVFLFLLLAGSLIAGEPSVGPTLRIEARNHLRYGQRDDSVSPLQMISDLRGEWIATWCEDQTIRIWDARDGKPNRVFRLSSGRADTVAVSPGGDWVAYSVSDSLFVLERSSGKQLASFVGEAIAPGKFGRITGRAFTQDGKRLVALPFKSNGDLFVVATGGWQVMQASGIRIQERRLQGLAMRPQDEVPIYSDNALDYYPSERVKELTGGKQSPVTVKPDTVPDFPIAIILP